MAALFLFRLSREGSNPCGRLKMFITNTISGFQPVQELRVGGQGRLIC